MKRAITLIVIVALAVAFCTGVIPHSDELVSKVTEKLSPVSTVTEKLSPAVEKAKEKAKELLPSSEDAEDLIAALEDAAKSKGAGGLSLPSPGNIVPKKGILTSTDDVVLVPTDDYAKGYVFEYDGEQFTAYFDTYSWRVYDSYKITAHDDIVIICQALIDEHPVYGSDWTSLRTAEDMVYEWEQHNLIYWLLPESSHWRDDAKDVDLDPYDQGKSFAEIYESRTGQKLDLRNYLPGE